MNIIIGRGEDGTVYNHKDNNKVIKKSNFINGFTKNELKYYNLFNKYPNFLVHVYELGKNYVILEKVNTNFKLEYLLDFLEEIKVWVDEDPIANIYEDIRKKNYKTIKYILLKLKESKNEEIIINFKKYIKLILDINNAFPNDVLDIHSGNLGIGNDNKLKFFDINL